MFMLNKEFKVEETVSEVTEVSPLGQFVLVNWIFKRSPLDFKEKYCLKLHWNQSSAMEA